MLIENYFSRNTIMNINYVGLFGNVFDEKRHVTFAYFKKSDSYEKRVEWFKKIPESVLYNTYSIQIEEVGKTDFNTALRVELPEELKPLFYGYIPHITLKVEKDGKAADSWKCFTKESKARIPLSGIIDMVFSIRFYGDVC